jgi:YNFM family putative membrane transporter
MIVADDPYAAAHNGRPALSERARPKRITAMGAAMHAVGGGLGWSFVPALMPEIARDLALSHTESGLVWGATSLGIALASPAGGLAVDRHGARRVGAVAMAIGALGCAARVLATGALSLALAMVLFGVHFGLLAPAILKALAGHVSPGRMTRANGLTLLGYTFGTAATVLLAGTVVAPLLGGWRPAMGLAAAAMAVGAIGWWAVVRDREAHCRHAPLVESIGLLRDPTLRAVAAMYFLLFGGYLALLGLLPRALIEAGLGRGDAAIAVALWLVAAGIANLVGPQVAHRIGRRALIVAGSLVTSGALGALAIAPASSAIPCLIVAGVGGGSFAPLLLAMPFQIRAIGPVRAGAALELLILFGQLGGASMSVAVGVIVDGPLGLAGASLALAVVHAAIVVPAIRSPRAGGLGGRERTDEARTESALA